MSEYSEDVGKFASPVNEAAVQAIVKYCGIALRNADSSLVSGSDPEELARVKAVLATHTQEGVAFHALRTRQAGSRRFVSCHVLVPGHWSVQQGHDFCEEVEARIAAELPRCHCFTHLEPIEDPRAWDDEHFSWDGSARG